MLKFTPYSQVSIVNGYGRGGLIDHDQMKVFFLPTNFIDYLLSDKINWETINNEFQDYYKIIKTNELGLLSDIGSAFEKMDYEYNHYSLVDNVVLSINSSLDHSKIITFLNFFKVRALKIIIDELDKGDLNKFIKALFKSTVEDIQFVFKSRNQIENIDFDHPGISLVHLSDQPIGFGEKIGNIHLVGKDIWPYHYMTFSLFTESQAHHAYFNRKLSIGPNGEIKNALECLESFGFIEELDSPEELQAIVETASFQKYWFVHKEFIDVCQDCELRHMCVDNRLPYERNKNEWYHKQECNYNPYIAKWKNEEGYRTLEECGVISNENEFSIDHDKIAAINEELWGSN